MRARTSRPLVILVLLALVALALVLLPRPAGAQVPSGTLEGELAPSGVSLAWWGGGTPEALVAAASDAGCSANSVWVTVDGRFRGYAPASPDFANQGFLSLFPGGAMGAGPVLLVCGPQEVAAPLSLIHI